MAAVASLASLFFLIFLFYIHARIIATSSDGSQKTYIVYVSETEKLPLNTTHCDWYSSILHTLSPLSTDLDLYSSESLLCPSTPLSTAPPHLRSSNTYYDLTKTKLLYCYEHAIHGFAARLSASEAAELRRRPEILSVIPDRISQLQTTRSPQFLSLNDSSGIWPFTNYGDDVIIGVIDTGIQPDHPSFSDAGLSPVPATWRGTCERAFDFPSCNRKVIGARAYYRGYEEQMQQSMEQLAESTSPADYNGHGTHVASTAAGSRVRNAGFYQYAIGEAKGTAIRARIAAYKVYWRGGYLESDVLAAMDQAILDGVHVLSLSLGSNQARPYYEDPIAVASFRAAARGILTSCAGGNYGPSDGTAVNIAPWILTVGASTIDREFRADVALGDGSILQGVSLYSNNGSPPPPGHVYGPLVYATGSGFCRPNELNPFVVRGKIVVCDVGGDIVGVAKGYAVHLAGGIGMILVDTEQQEGERCSKAHLIPATMVGVTDGNKIKNYIRSQSSPTAIITFKGTVVGRTPPAPRVWALSGRGPNVITPEILKPDVIAPRVDILAAWSKFVSPSGLDDIDPRRVEFNIISGTSMACPHLSGIAALLRKAYPNWTPAAIKSAIMTTSYNVDNSGRNIVDLATGRESTPFAHGSGHVDPNKGLNPGLVYDMKTSDYVQFLCAIGYTPDKIAIFVPGPVSCNPGITPGDLNYPSFSVVFSNDRTVVKHTRKVKNVGTVAAAVYTVKGQAPAFVQVTVSPDRLMFGKHRHTLTYEVTFTSLIGTIADNTPPAFGWLEWSNEQRIVRSPIAFLWIPDSGVDSM